MLKIPISPAASAVLRELIAKTGVPRNRILLMNVRSIDWQSLTFVGERHELHLRIRPPRSEEIAKRIRENLKEAEFDIPGHFLADIATREGPSAASDGATMLIVEALTIQD